MLAAGKADSYSRSVGRIKNARSSSELADEVTRLALKLVKKGAQAPPQKLNFQDNQLPVTDIIERVRPLLGEDSEYIFHQLGTEISDINKNKIMAVIACMESDLPYDEWHVFEKVGEAFNNQLPNLSHIQPLTPGECAWTVKCLRSIREKPLSDEVKTYIASCLHDDGFLMCPSELSMCSENLVTFTNMRDLEPLKSLYADKAITHPIEMVRVQLQRLAAVDAYIEEKAVLK